MANKSNIGALFFMKIKNFVKIHSIYAVTVAKNHIVFCAPV